MPLEPQASNTLFSKDHARIHRVVDMEADTPEGSLLFDSDGNAVFGGNVSADNLSGNNTGDETTATLGTKTAGATEKATPIDLDILGYADTEATNVLKKLTWANVKAFLKTYFDTLYSVTSHNHTGVYAPVLGGDDNYVTDAEKTKLSNLSGTNTGDQDLSGKADLASPTFTGTVSGITKAMVGLTNVDDTSDATKNSATATLTNKRWTKRVGTTTSSATPTINTDNYDEYGLTAQTADIISFTTNLSGTPTDGQTLIIRITGTASRAITWGAGFASSTEVTLPTTTSGTKTLVVGFKIINAVSSTVWQCVASCNVGS